MTVFISLRSLFVILFQALVQIANPLGNLLYVLDCSITEVLLLVPVELWIALIIGLVYSSDLGQLSAQVTHNIDITLSLLGRLITVHFPLIELICCLTYYI